MNSPTIVYCNTLSSVLRRLHVERPMSEGVLNERGRFSLVELRNFTADPKAMMHVVSGILRKALQAGESVVVGLVDVNNGIPLRKLSSFIRQWKSQSIRVKLGQTSSRLLATKLVSPDFLLEAVEKLKAPLFGELFVTTGNITLGEIEQYACANANAVHHDGLIPFLCDCMIADSVTFSLILDYQQTLSSLTSPKMPAPEILRGITSALDELKYKDPLVQEVL